MSVLGTKCDWISYLQNQVLVPLDSVCVEIGSWVEPKSVLDLTAADTIAEEVGVKNVRVPGQVSEKLEVVLVVSLSRRSHLHETGAKFGCSVMSRNTLKIHVRQHEKPNARRRKKFPKNRDTPK